MPQMSVSSPSARRLPVKACAGPLADAPARPSSTPSFLLKAVLLPWPDDASMLETCCRCVCAQPIRSSMLSAPMPAESSSVIAASARSRVRLAAAM